MAPQANGRERHVRLSRPEEKRGVGQEDGGFVGNALGSSSGNSSFWQSSLCFGGGGRQRQRAQRRGEPRSLNLAKTPCTPPAEPLGRGVVGGGVAGAACSSAAPSAHSAPANDPPTFLQPVVTHQTECTSTPARTTTATTTTTSGNSSGGTSASAPSKCLCAGGGGASGGGRGGAGGGRRARTWGGRSRLPFHKLPFEVQAYHLQQQSHHRRLVQAPYNEVTNLHHHHHHPNLRNHHHCSSPTAQHPLLHEQAPPSLFPGSDAENAWFPLMPPAVAGLAPLPAAPPPPAPGGDAGAGAAAGDPNERSFVPPPGYTSSSGVGLHAATAASYDTPLAGHGGAVAATSASFAATTTSASDGVCEESSGVVMTPSFLSPAAAAAAAAAGAFVADSINGNGRSGGGSSSHRGGSISSSISSSSSSGGGAMDEIRGDGDACCGRRCLARARPGEDSWAPWGETAGRCWAAGAAAAAGTIR